MPIADIGAAKCADCFFRYYAKVAYHPDWQKKHFKANFRDSATDSVSGRDKLKLCFDPEQGKRIVLFVISIARDGRMRMFKHIMVPVDLAEKETLKKAVRVAADLAKHYDARLTLVSVSGGLQGKVSHSNKEYGRLLSLYSDEIAMANSIKVDNVNYSVPDPSVEVDQKLIHAIEELDVDLVVMASHQPNWVEYIINSHGGKLASHARISVFVVREHD